MESLFPLFTSIIAIIIIYYLFLKSQNTSKKKSPPQPGGGWPVIGHLPLLALAKQPAHIILGNLADKYGPIFTINFGVHPTLVVSNSEIAKECLTKNDRAFASRPKSLAMEILGYNYQMIGFAPYGDYWRQIRKIATIELLSSYRLDKLKHVREAEVKAAVKDLYQEWSKNENQNVEMKRWFFDRTSNVILKIIVGKRYVEYGENDNEGKDNNDVWRDTLREFIKLVGKFAVSDAVPCLRWLDLGGIEKEMKKVFKKLDSIVDEWLEERKKKKEFGRSKGDEDFMDLLLSILNDTVQFSDRDADTINKATCLSLILAASDTTTNTMTWALSLLLNNRDILKKVQHELDEIVGKNRQVTESDIKSLVYFQAVVKETFRLYPAAPLLIPHESVEECTIDGYHIPAGTQLFINAAKIQRDSSVWVDPLEFIPERFLTTEQKDIDVKGQHFELLPFGSGRRMCPGISFGLQVLNLTLATLLHAFDIQTLSGNPLDMSEAIGITNMKATPVEVFLTPRLPSQLY
ncbi:cytochrome P450 CYP82D47-like [Euphorbia lathyris]|uniref:cytochrome P450 CYP82D47-like n=1 Tax=Euphorbia lathyris TaxID=212925 RepID=UPI003313EFFF